MRVAVVGATGLVGTELLGILERAPFPVRSVTLYASQRSRGRRIAFRGEELIVRELEPAEVAAHDVVFLSAGAAVSRDLHPVLRCSRAVVADNTSAFRLDPAVPLVVPAVNGPTLRPEHGYVAVPNCTAILLVLALAPLHRAFGLRRVVVSTYQAISGAGARALHDLRQQALAELGGAAPDPASLAFNLRPAIGALQETSVEDGWHSGEELKVIAETRRILAIPDLRLAATCVRVPIFRVHSEAVWIELDGQPALAQVRETLRAAPRVVLADDPANDRYPVPKEASGGDRILVGRIRSGGSPGAVSFFLCGDQLRLGAATTAVEIVESVFAARYREAADGHGTEPAVA